MLGMKGIALILDEILKTSGTKTSNTPVRGSYISSFKRSSFQFCIGFAYENNWVIVMI